MAPDWLTQADWTLVPLSALLAYATVILFTRLNGLRSFSTMSSFDLAMTVAVGSTVASTVLNPRPSVLEGALALASLFLLQRTVAFLRRWDRLEIVIDNQPRLLVRRGEVHHENLRRCHMRESDLRAKAREAGVARLEDVEVAVMETTGTVSVVPRREGVRADDWLLEGVRA